MGFLSGLLVLALLIGVPVAVAIALSRTREMRVRIERLERRVEVLSHQVQRTAADAGDQTSQPPTAVRTGSRPGETATDTSQVPARSQSAPATTQQSAPPRPSRSREAHPDAGWIDAIAARIRRWFTHGNVPVKVGIVVLFAGVAALLKYVADQGWLHFPIQWRLTGIAVLALAALAFGWRQRRLRRTFALSVQGGAIGVLLMTAFAAYRLYDLLDPAVAFGAWVVLAAAAGLLAVLQEERALAVLGILAGFLAPVLMSTGAGNHVVLFSFYAVLNAAIFAIAWYRSWRELNLLGFAFTFGIGTLWGIEHYSPDKFATTLPFLLLFFGFYLLLPLLHARRADAAGRRIVDASLVFGTPLVAFAQLAALLDGNDPALAASALGLGALYAVLARGRRAPVPLLQQAYAALAVGFATLAAPLALSAEATASVFALEGAALVWFGTAQSRRLSRWAGTALQLLAALQMAQVIGTTDALQPLANAAFMGMLLLSLAGFASAWSVVRAGADDDDYGLAWYLWGLTWWLVATNREIGLFVPVDAGDAARIGLAAFTAAAAALALRLDRGPALAWTIAAALAAAVPLALSQVQQVAHPFEGAGLAAWAGFALLGAFALHALRVHASRHAVAIAHGAWLIALTLVVALWLRWVCATADLAEGWRHAAFALPWLLVGGLLTGQPRWMSWPLQQRFDAWRVPLLTTWFAIVAVIALGLLLVPGDAAPLPWIPLLNPVELVLCGSVLLLAVGFFRNAVPAVVQALRAPVLAGALFLVATSVTLRAVHQLGDLPWDGRLFDTALAQASLSLVWSVLGVAGWVAGSHRRQRELWLVGAVLMAVVLAKLVLVDRLHLGNLPGIASFIGYGLLCTVVGYLAPAPPRAATA